MVAWETMTLGRTRMIMWESTTFGGAVSTVICIRIGCKVHSSLSPSQDKWRDGLGYKPERVNSIWGLV